MAFQRRLTFHTAPLARLAANVFFGALRAYVLVALFCSASVTNAGGTLAATNNWWGAADGPTPPGHGDTISGTVSFNPFLTSAIFACPTLDQGFRLYLPVIER